MTEATQRTSDSGVSIWLDDLSRSRIESGSLQDLIANKNVVGVTTNPSIFQKALHEVGPYDPQLKELGKVDVETAVRELTTTDVRNATDIFREVAEKSDFVDGRVSIEVDPRLAHETEATEKQAEELWAKVNRPNAMIKIPATLEGLPAITATLAKGISVNVTLIFSLERYEQVIDAYTHDMLESLKVFLIIQRHNAAMPNVGWCEAMTMLFENNAKMASKYFDRKLGVLEAGAAADVIVMDYKPFTPLSEENIDGHMLFGMMGKNCRTTIINGRVLYKDREFVGIDEDKINAWTMAESKKLWSTLNERTY